MLKECVLVVCDALHLLHYWMMCAILSAFLTCLKCRRRIIFVKHGRVMVKVDVKHNRLRTIDKSNRNLLSVYKYTGLSRRVTRTQNLSCTELWPAEVWKVFQFSRNKNVC